MNYFSVLMDIHMYIYSGSVWPLKAGESTLTTDVCSRLHFEKAPLTGFLKSVTNAQASVTGYLIGKTGSGTGSGSSGSEKPAGRGIST
jgi:hypothetical protein